MPGPARMVSDGPIGYRRMTFLQILSFPWVSDTPRGRRRREVQGRTVSRLVPRKNDSFDFWADSELWVIDGQLSMKIDDDVDESMTKSETLLRN